VRQGLAGGALSKPKLLFLATEDWFVRSHFLPLLRRAQADGFEVVVAARLSGALGDIADARLIDTPFARGSMLPWDIAQQIAHLRTLLTREAPDVVHAIALKPMVLLALSGHRDAGLVFALTGRGYLGVRQSLWVRSMNDWLRSTLRAALRQARTLLLVENTADRDWLGADLEPQTLIMPGAGVDPKVFASAPPPHAGPIVIGVVARLIWTKGVDLLVEAAQCLRGQGEDIVLRIAGDADRDSPEAVPASEIERWRALDGVEVLGRVDDVSAFWAGAHIACLPSRGGEGLPRSLLEAAACARPIVTTDAPGCRDLVTADIGVVTPREDVAALTEALQRLVQDKDLRASMGAAARAKIVGGYTETHAAAVASRAWSRVTAA
jgi:glycosyltransferase involved in cell wall biosynthesis